MAAQKKKNQRNEKVPIQICKFIPKMGNFHLFIFYFLKGGGQNLVSFGLETTMCCFNIMIAV